MRQAKLEKEEKERVAKEWYEEQLLKVRISLKEEAEKLADAEAEELKEMKRLTKKTKTKKVTKIVTGKNENAVESVTERTAMLNGGESPMNKNEAPTPLNKTSNGEIGERGEALTVNDIGINDENKPLKDEK